VIRTFYLVGLLPLILPEGEKVLNLASILERSCFDSPWYRNGVIYLKFKTTGEKLLINNVLVILGGVRYLEKSV